MGVAPHGGGAIPPRLLNPAENQLLQRYGSAAAALDALPDLAERAGRRRPLLVCSRGAAEREMTAVERVGARLVAWGEPDYPAALAATDDAPALLSLRGNAALLARPAIAMVGARNASANGRRFARDLALQLGGRGLVVVSGLARAIDAAAHQGALPTGTIAVVAAASTLSIPRRTAISCRSSPSWAPSSPRWRSAPSRRRAISRAATARFGVACACWWWRRRSARARSSPRALRWSRAAKSSPCRARRSIRAAAAPTISSAAAPISPKAPTTCWRSSKAIWRRRCAAQRPAFEPAPPPPGPAELGAAMARVICCRRTPVPVDEVIRQCALPPAVVEAVLLDLELAGRLERQPGHQVALVG